MNQSGFDFGADAVTLTTGAITPLAPEIITCEMGLERYRGMIERHHAAMLAGDERTAMTLRKDAHDLAVSMNGGTSLGILGDHDAPGCMLERETAAEAGSVPLWGQLGDFVIDVDGMRVRIEQDGIFGIGSSCGFWLGFAAHAVDLDKPFLSETGYRSFIGLYAAAAAGMTPDTAAAEIIRAYVASMGKGKTKGKPVNITRRSA